MQFHQQHIISLSSLPAPIACNEVASSKARKEIMFLEQWIATNSTRVAYSVSAITISNLKVAMLGWLIALVASSMITNLPFIVMVESMLVIFLLTITIIALMIITVEWMIITIEWMIAYIESTQAIYQLLIVIFQPIFSCIKIHFTLAENRTRGSPVLF